jgi:osmoprotectant transport system ATP-binding protein
VGVARALAADPPLLLCDEPFGALDPLTRAALQQEFVKVQRSLGKSALFVTHDLREALVVADRIALLDQGRLAVLDTPAGFMAAAHPLAEAFRDSLALPEAAR